MIFQGNYLTYFANMTRTERVPKQISDICDILKLWPKHSEGGHKYNRNATENSIFWRENCNCLYFFSYSVMLISNLFLR